MDQSLNSKIMNQCDIDFSGIKKGAKISFHRHFKTTLSLTTIQNCRSAKQCTMSDICQVTPSLFP